MFSPDNDAAFASLVRSASRSMLCNAKDCHGRGCGVCAGTGLQRCDRHFRRPAVVSDSKGAWCAECAEVKAEREADLRADHLAEQSGFCDHTDVARAEDGR